MPASRGLGFLLVAVVVGTACHSRAEPANGLAGASGSQATGIATAASLVGVWRVAKFCERDSTGRLVEPYGPNPTGYFVYAPSGQLSIQLMCTPPVRDFKGVTIGGRLQETPMTWVGLDLHQRYDSGRT